MPRRAFTTLVCTLVLGTGALTAVSDGAATAAVTPTIPAANISWTPCGDQLECAKVTVPLDYAKPDGKQIELAVTRHLASHPDRRIGSVFVNPGGPGESGVEIVTENGALLDEWGEGRFDVVGWDPRGTNASTRVECFRSQAAEDAFWKNLQIPTTPAASTAYASKMAELSRRCRRVSGDLLRHISTADTARDLDALRQGVGDESLTFIGLSYGTMLGRTYANMFPQNVRAMMLDSLADEDEYSGSAEARIVGAVSTTDGVFDQFLALCQGAGPDACPLAAHPETVKTRVDRLFEQTRRSPVPAPNADPPGELTYSDLLLTTFTPMRDPNMWPQYARALDAAADGDASALETAARPMRSATAFSKATTSAAIQCADAAAKEPVSAWPKVMKRITAAGKLWGPILGWWQWAPCAANWPRSTDNYSGPWNAKTKNPLLLISNVYDPATPYYGAQGAEKALGNAVLLTVAGYGHPSYQLPSRCTDNARIRYLVDLVTPPKGTVCRDDTAPFDRTVPSAGAGHDADEVPGN
ncbi:MAG TPA: alpha/beta hydrolase [Acidimicrobiia bacterium]|nr:alpha/beta hydrolase [Acidimicrobiia bacterium]